MSGTGREGKQSQVQVKSKMDRWERYSTFLDWKNQYCQNDCTTQGNLQIAILIKLPMSFFTELEQKKSQNLYGNTKDPE